MAIIFPPLESASPEGLLAIGGHVDNQTLLTAYSQGIFPWPISKDSPLTWFSPDPRGLLFTKDFHLSKSLTKFIKSTSMQVRFNKNFDEVLKNCAEAKRKHETGTWITDEIINGYSNFFKAGHAYSVEVYKDEELVGGLYGVIIGKYLSGESMFHKETNASKLALYSLISILKINDINWLDTQMVTPIIESMGGKHLSRNIFIQQLNQAVNSNITRDEIFMHDLNSLDQP